MTQNQSGDERTYWPLERWLFEVDRRVLFAIALGIAAIMDGVFVTPNIEDWLAVAQSPFSTPDFSNPLNSYIMSSPLPAVFAGLLGADRHWAVFGAFHLLLLVTVVWLTMRAASHVHPDADRLVLAVFIAAPISTVTLTWLGQPDPLVIGLGSALVFLRRPIPLALVGILLGLSSFEQGAFIVLSVGLVAAPLLGAVWWRHTLASGIGILVGRAAFTLYHAAFDIEQATTRYDWIRENGLTAPIRSAISWWPFLLFSLFSAAWILVGSWFWIGRDLGAPLKRVAAAFLVAFLVAMLAYDQTRVFSIISWPILLAMACWTASRFDPVKVRHLTTLSLGAGLLIPTVLVGVGGLYGSAYFEILNWLRPS